MGTIVRSLKVLGEVALVFLLLTYVISLNMEIGFINIGSNLISNSFLFAVFSGIFASILVVLICDLHKYFDTKKRVENLLFVQLAYLYGQLLLIRNNIGRSLHNPTESLDHKLLQFSTSNASAFLNNIKGIEYCTYGGKSSIERILQLFINDEAVKLEGFLINCGILDIAIHEDAIKYMQCGKPNPVITSASEKSHKVLVILNKQVEGYINEVDSILINIDIGCNNRFNWIQRRNIMSQNVLYSKFDGVDEFIAKNT